MLLVDGLAADPELVRDLLPRPRGVSSVPDLERLELLEQLAERGDRPRPTLGSASPAAPASFVAWLMPSMYVDRRRDVNLD